MLFNLPLHFFKHTHKIKNRENFNILRMNGNSCNFLKIPRIFLIDFQKKELFSYFWPIKS